MELIIDRVSKQYKNRIAVDRVSLRLTKGVHGLLYLGILHHLFPL